MLTPAAAHSLSLSLSALAVAGRMGTGGEAAVPSGRAAGGRRPAHPRTWVPRGLRTLQRPTDMYDAGAAGDRRGSASKQHGSPSFIGAAPLTDCDFNVGLIPLSCPQHQGGRSATIDQQGASRLDRSPSREAHVGPPPHSSSHRHCHYMSRAWMHTGYQSRDHYLPVINSSGPGLQWW